MNKAFKEIKIEYIDNVRNAQNIAISFNDGRYGTDVKWINIDEAKGIVNALKGIVEEVSKKIG